MKVSFRICYDHEEWHSVATLTELLSAQMKYAITHAQCQVYFLSIDRHLLPFLHYFTLCPITQLHFHQPFLFMYVNTHIYMKCCKYDMFTHYH